MNKLPSMQRHLLIRHFLFFIIISMADCPRGINYITASTRIKEVTKALPGSVLFPGPSCN
jgi:hypothetical protein